MEITYIRKKFKEQEESEKKVILFYENKINKAKDENKKIAYQVAMQSAKDRLQGVYFMAQTLEIFSSK